MSIFDDIGDFASDAVKTAGKGIHSGVKAVSKATGAVTKEIGKIPAVGPAFEAVLDGSVRAPFKITDDVMSGKRIDKVALNALNDQVMVLRKAGPYAQMVISFVPGVGTGVSAAIGAGVALANGRPLTAAMVEGIKGAIPGGPAVQGAFSTGLALAEGKRVDQALVQALPVPDSAKAAIALGVEFSGDLARGKKLSKEQVMRLVSKLPAAAASTVKLKIDAGAPFKEVTNVAIDQALKAAPKKVQVALQTGIATAVAKEIQKEAVKAIQTNSKQLVKVGAQRMNDNPVIRAASRFSSDRKAFALGMGLVTHANVPKIALRTARKGLATEAQRNSFDAAIATHIGMVTSKAPDLKKLAALSPEQQQDLRNLLALSKLTPAQQAQLVALKKARQSAKRIAELNARRKAAFYLTTGTRRASGEVRTKVIRPVLRSKQGRAGAALAVKHVKKEKGWLRRLVTWLGF